MSIHGLLLIYAAIVGLLVGSYLNVLIYRLPRGISTVLPRSRCPQCSGAIRPWHNIPLLGYALLRGRCRACGAPIHWRYPLVEALNGGCTVLAFLWLGPTLATVAVSAFCSVMIVLGAIDLEHFVLPNRLVVPGLVLALALAPWLPWSSARNAWLGAALGAGILLVVAGGWYLLRGTAGMGMGDVKLLALIGAFLGWHGALLALGVGSAFGSLAIFVALVLQRSVPLRIPFGAFLCAGAVFVLFTGLDTGPDYPWHDILADAAAENRVAHTELGPSIGR